MDNYWQCIQSSPHPGIKAIYKIVYVKTEVNKTANPTMLWTLWEDSIFYSPRTNVWEHFV